VARIVKVEKVKDSEKLLKMQEVIS